MCVNTLAKYKKRLMSVEDVVNDSATSSLYLEGVMGVRSLPMVWITLRPHTHSPMQMPAPPYSSSQMGVGSLEVTLLLV